MTDEPSRYGTGPDDLSEAEPDRIIPGGLREACLLSDARTLANDLSIARFERDAALARAEEFQALWARAEEQRNEMRHQRDAAEQRLAALEPLESPLEAPPTPAASHSPDSADGRPAAAQATARRSS